MANCQLVGDFDFHPIVGLYKPRLVDIRPTEPLLGLNHQVVYLYGGLRDAAGKLHVVERKFIGAMTAGLWLMSAKEGSLRLDPGSACSTRGEVHREYGDDAYGYADQLVHRLGKKLLSPDYQPLDLRVTADAISWSEGKLLAVEGPLVGPGLQVYAPMRREAFFLASRVYRTVGSIRGSKVDGFLWLDVAYWPYGRDWESFPIQQELVRSWQVFGNEYADGTMEWGHLCWGRRGFSFGAVLNAECALVMGTGISTLIDLDAEDWITRARFEFGDQIWESTAEPEGRLQEFSSARGRSYRAQCGITHRLGDHRRLRMGFTWMDCFPQRVRGEDVPVVSPPTAG